MQVINYIRNGHRSSITATKIQKTAIQKIKERENISDNKKFVNVAIKEMGQASNISMTVRDYIIKKLMEYAGMEE